MGRSDEEKTHKMISSMMNLALLVIGVANGLRPESGGIRVGVRRASSRVEIVEGDAAFASACVRQAMGCVQTSLDEGFSGRTFQYHEVRDEVSAVEDRLVKILARCSEVAPQCVSISEKGFEGRAIVLARLASWTEEKNWVRDLQAWGEKTNEKKKDKGERDLPLISSSDLKNADPDAALEALVIYLIEKYQAPESLRQALFFYGDILPVSTRDQRLAYRFSQAYFATGAGRSNVRKALNDQGFSLTKKCASLIASDHILQSYDLTTQHPLRILRYAQIEALGGPQWLADAVATNSKVSDYFTNDEDFIAHDALKWLVTHAASFEDNPGFAPTALEFFDEMRRADKHYSCAGRTVKTVSNAMEGYMASTVSFDDIDEAFLPNPRGLRPMFLADASLDETVTISVPYDQSYQLGPGSGRLDIKDRVLRVEEILSLQRLIYEGLQLDNCLEDRQSSQIKYLTRARQRASSFWSFTLGPPPEDKNDDSKSTEKKPKHILLLEVWHLSGQNIVRQAEGPRPRTIPSPEAWYYMKKWCDANNVDWSTWDIYSRLDGIYPCDPL